MVLYLTLIQCKVKKISLRKSELIGLLIVRLLIFACLCLCPSLPSSWCHWLRYLREVVMHEHI